jgi:flavin reductase (DIM6/NTAB) family NADH-FMN oxidoreductase RutF
MHRALTGAPTFAVNILGSDQAHLARRFAAPAADRFAGVASRPAADGVPLLDGTIATLRCTRHDLLEGGDHTIVLGRVVDLRVAEGEPLLYARGAFLDLSAPDWGRALATAPHEWLLSAPW